MLAIGIRYLTGYVAATDAANFHSVEWPPHPGRVFMALAAAHFESGQDAAEREALEHLEALDPPLMLAGESDYRTVARAYVPANDAEITSRLSRKLARGGTPGPGEQKVGLQLLPERRHRSERTFPKAWLHDDVVHLLWEEAEVSASQRAALTSLCAKVTRIGHSASLVQAWLCDEAETRGVSESAVAGDAELDRNIWQPQHEHPAASRWRIAGAGMMDYLETRFNQPAVEGEEEKGEPLRPVLGRSAAYARPEGGRQAPPSSVFDPRLVLLRLTPRESRFRRLDSVSTLAVTAALHRALIAQAERQGEVPEFLSGHRPDGSPSKDPHVALLPVPFAGHPEADGHLLGVAVALPQDLPREVLRLVATAIEGIVNEGLRINRSLGAWSAQRAGAESPLKNLRADIWTGGDMGAARWASVTPVALDRHPKARRREDQLDAIATWLRTACSEQLGLPAPTDVQVTQTSGHLGAPAARDFPRLRRKDGTERCHTHAILRFNEPVRGPALLGAGRFRGYGLFRPLPEEHAAP